MCIFDSVSIKWIDVEINSDANSIRIFDPVWMTLHVRVRVRIYVIVSEFRSVFSLGERWKSCRAGWIESRRPRALCGWSRCRTAQTQTGAGLDHLLRQLRYHDCYQVGFLRTWTNFNSSIFQRTKHHSSNKSSDTPAWRLTLIAPYFHIQTSIRIIATCCSNWLILIRTK